MVKAFAAGDRVYVRTQQVWQILTAHVMMEQGNLTYGELATWMGHKKQAARTLAPHLGLLANFCIENNLPCLNTIVVGKASGEPGHAVLMRPGTTVEQEQQAVLEFDWFSVRTPTTGALRKVWDGPSDSD
ncbi:MAG: hypothetical protein JWQ89_3667 [Devosia sp.]|uniref:hypothetical protein n=1 Tax=Devosia sp. TaxID=1871048 RepID=UPI0026256FE5|nr:hypothetical protein [Devosia sp.]MDB5541940.1 hypothetical protein [Devosia sp.]